MSMLGPSKERLLRLLQQAEALVARFQGEAQHWSEVARALGHENAGLHDRLNRAQVGEAKLRDVNDDLCAELTTLKEESEGQQADVEALHEELELCREDVESAQRQIHQTTVAWNTQREMLEERVDRGLETESGLRDDISVARAEKRRLEVRVAELEGAVKAWSVLLQRDEAGPKGKRTLQQQAAIARLAKKGLSAEARQKVLRSAVTLGVLPEELYGELEDGE